MINDDQNHDDIDNTPSAYIANSDTSKARAKREDELGITAKRRRQIWKIVRDAGAVGATWAEIADVLGLHHGQVSGALNALHKLGIICQLATTRKECHPYIDGEYMAQYQPHELIVEPKKSGRTKYVEALEELAEAAYNVAYKQSNGDAYNRLRRAIDIAKQYDRGTK